MPEFFAHSAIGCAKSRWQLLPQHAFAVAELAQDFGAALGIGRAARLAGLLHDLGKYNPAFQAYIDGRGEGVGHSTAGAWWVRQLARPAAPLDRVVADLIGYAIAGHHAGLPDRRGGAASLDQRLDDFIDQLDPVWQSQLAPDTAGLMPALNWVRARPDDPLSRQRFAFQLAMLGRLVFSCLVDADFRDTEAFYARLDGREIDRSWPALPSLIDMLIGRFDGYMAEKSLSEDPINRLRTEILGRVRGKAGLPPGFFTLTVPTGGGKTLASLGFALDHARRHGLRRLIYAIPFTSIIDQTAAIFRDVLGEDLVLEHHSAIEDERDGSAGAADSRDQRQRLRRAMEDWEAPVVVTTNVQFFESLFAARPARARKLHNIAGSVIVLDEAQSLPLRLLGPAVWALEALVRDWGCSVVLCTATQPALARSRLGESPAARLVGLDLDPARELAPDAAALFGRFRRVTLRRAGPLTDAQLVGALADVPQALVIVNSRPHALALYRAARDASLDGVVHLSTRQHAADRRRILANIGDRLRAGLSCRLIATSLVEAGVDLDFPRAWRAEAGLEQIVQAAGRVNRHGRRPVEESLVTLFSAPDNPPPPEIRQFVAAMRRMEGDFSDEELFSPAAIERYFREVYWQKGNENLDRGVVDGQSVLAKFGVDPNETAFAYRSAAENFRMIESGMQPVIVPSDETARAAVNELSIEKIPTGRLARVLQAYTVGVPPRARDQLFKARRIRFEAPDLRGDAFPVLTDMDLYTAEKGLLWEDPSYLAADRLMV